MTRRTIITLCAVIAVLVGIVAIGVWSLYSGVSPEAPEAELQRQEDTTAIVAPVASEEHSKVVTEETPAKQEKSSKAVNVPKGPFRVKNTGTGKVNTISQNKDNSIVLKDENGKELWKKALGAKLCGMVGEVDFYRNGKIQFLMVEGSKVHLIDRLGKEVEGFPMTLQSKGILGPEKVSVKGTNYWKVLTEDGEVYLNIKKKLIMTDLPE